MGRLVRVKTKQKAANCGCSGPMEKSMDFGTYSDVGKSQLFEGGYKPATELTPQERQMVAIGARQRRKMQGFQADKNRSLKRALGDNAFAYHRNAERDIRGATRPGPRGFHFGESVSPEHEARLREAIGRTGVRGRGRGVVLHTSNRLLDPRYGRHLEGAASAAALPRSGLTGGRGHVVLGPNVMSGWGTHPHPEDLFEPGTHPKQQTLDVVLAHEAQHANVGRNPTTRFSAAQNEAEEVRADKYAHRMLRSAKARRLARLARIGKRDSMDFGNSNDFGSIAKFEVTPHMRQKALEYEAERKPVWNRADRATRRTAIAGSSVGIGAGVAGLANEMRLLHRGGRPGKAANIVRGGLLGTSLAGTLTGVAGKNKLQQRNRQRAANFLAEYKAPNARDHDIPRNAPVAKFLVGAALGGAAGYGANREDRRKRTTAGLTGAGIGAVGQNLPFAADAGYIKRNETQGYVRSLENARHSGEYEGIIRDLGRQAKILRRRGNRLGIAAVGASGGGYYGWKRYKRKKDIGKRDDQPNYGPAYAVAGLPLGAGAGYYAHSRGRMNQLIRRNEKRIKPHQARHWANVGLDRDVLDKLPEGDPRRAVQEALIAREKSHGEFWAQQSRSNIATRNKLVRRAGRVRNVALPLGVVGLAGVGGVHAWRNRRSE